MGIRISILFLALTMVNSAMADNTFFDLGNGTVIDLVSGLTWQQGLTSEMNWEAAISYCENRSGLGGKSDWRLPNIKELQSLVDYSKISPTINLVYFPNTTNDIYWSSTSYPYPNADQTVIVSFYDGHVSNLRKNATHGARVRCVRSRQ